MKQFLYLKSLIVLLLVFLRISLSEGQSVGTPYIIPYTKEVIFQYTGEIQTWVVPSNVNQITVEVSGAQGGDFSTRAGGAGGRVIAKLAVTPNSTLYLIVGGKPINTARNIPLYGFGGQGGNTQFTGEVGAAGGGLSAISTSPTFTHVNVLIVAGGGGGATGGTNVNVGGAAGGLVGSYGGTNNWTLAGGGGTQTAGGSAGTGGDPNNPDPTPGSALKGGNGGISLNAASTGWKGGGGGGAGYYGGGGGKAGGNSQGAGGGGSSWSIPSASNVSNLRNINLGHGSIHIKY
jgi:hypothetical protein